MKTDDMLAMKNLMLIVAAKDLLEVAERQNTKLTAVEVEQLATGAVEQTIEDLYDNIATALKQYNSGTHFSCNRK